MKNKSMTSEEVKQREDDFQMWQHHFRDFDDQESSDWCFYAIKDCCHNIALKKAVGKQISDLDDVVMDATLDIFKKWKEGTDIKKLSSFCYLYVIGRLYDKKKQFVDRELSLEAYEDNEYNKENR